MKKHTQIRHEVTAALQEFIQSDWVQQENHQRYIQWGIYLMTFLLLSSINTLSMSWVLIQFKEHVSGDVILIGGSLIELGLLLSFICKTPLKKFLTESTNRIKWE